MSITARLRKTRKLFSDEQAMKLRKFQAFRLRGLQCFILRLLYGSNLRNLAVIYGSDKWGKHQYSQYYEKLFTPIQRKRMNILEIGIGGESDPDCGGGSLRMWRTYFLNSKIFGIDIYDKHKHDESRIKTYKGSQADEDFLLRVVRDIGDIHIIVDDGSHLNEDVLRSFKFLFPYLHQGGYYIIEDTQTSYWSQMGGDYENVNCSDTSMEFFKKLTDGLNYAEFPDQAYSPNYYDQNIVAIHFFHNLVIIEKGLNNEIGEYRNPDHE